jgi:structural maintenance of chromosome 2
MIEETAGTAYYNKTKLESEKIIEKKEQKLKAINDILGQSIQPQMQKLDADRRRYLAFKDKESLLQHLEQKLRIYELVNKKRHLYQR